MHRQRKAGNEQQGQTRIHDDYCVGTQLLRSLKQRHERRFRRYTAAPEKDRLLEALNSCAAYFPVGNLHYCAFGRLTAFQLACFFWMPAMIAAAWLVEV